MNKLKKKVEISLLHDEKVILWSSNEAQKEKLQSLGVVFLSVTSEVRLTKWDLGAQHKETQVERNHNWIGVEYLPLHL